MAATTAAVQLVTPYQDLFIARGLPDDFLDQLTAQANVLRQAMQSSGVAKTTRVSTTTEVKQLLRELRITLGVLDIAVEKACKSDRVNGPATLTGWKNAKNVRKPATLTDIPFVTSGAAPAPPSTQETVAPTATAGQAVGQPA